MEKRDRECGEDRDSKNCVGNSDPNEGDYRYPDQIEEGDDNADGFRAQPIKPTQPELALLFAREAARAGEKVTPMFADDLEAAIGPAMALLLVGLEGVRQ